MQARRLIFPSSAIVTIVVWMIIATRPASAYEHVRNGGFESGVTGWTVAHGASLSTAMPPEVAPAEGDASGKVTLAGQRFELRPGMSGALAAGAYEFSASVFASRAQSSVRVHAMGAGFEQATAVALDAGAWTPIQLAIDAPAASEVSITISGSGDPGDAIYIDAVKLTGAPPVTLTPTPAPATPVAPEQSLSPTVVATTAASPTPTAAPNDTIAAHLRNASFEEVGLDGAPIAWTKFGGVLSFAGDRARSGARAARFDSSTTSTKWLYQAVIVDPDETYAFGAWVWHDDPGIASVRLRVSWYASADASGESISSVDSTATLDAPAAGYRHLTTGSVSAPPNAHSARLRVVLAPLSASHATIFVDDASFEKAAPLLPAPDATEIVDAPRESSGGGRVSRVTGARHVASVANAANAADSHVMSTLLINEVLYDPDLDGADADGEWVEIYNAGTADVELAGWALRDNAGTIQLPQIIVPARDYAVVAASDGFFARYPTFEGLAAWVDGRIGNGLGNNGDRLALVAPDGSVVDAVSWGADASALNPSVDDVPEGHSIERSPPGLDSDTSDDFIDNHAPSPGRAFEPSDGNPKRQSNGSNIEILEATGEGSHEWAPWALLALSASALAGAVAWRAIDAVRGRTHAA